MKCPKPDCLRGRPRNAGVWEGSCVVVSSVPLCQVTTVYVSRKKERGFCFVLRTVSRRFSLLLYFIITSFVLFSSPS